MEYVQQLEQEFGKWAGVTNAVACASGTAALHLALEALELPQGSRIVIPEFTMVACARAATAAGLVPVFADCGEDLLLDPDQISHCLRAGNVSAIMPVHIYGRRCNMDEIMPQARRHGLAVIEDMAEIHGIPPHPESDAACWSFYKNKIVHGEEGGLVAFSATVKGAYAADRARELRCLGFNDDHDYIHRPRGWNHRMSNAHARLILDSLAQVTENQRRHRQVEAWYNARIPTGWHMPPRDAVWVYDLHLDAYAPGVVRDLNRRGIAVRMAFKPMSEQPEYLGHYERLRAHYASRRVLYLPVYPDMTEEHVNQIAQAVVSRNP